MRQALLITRYDDVFGYAGLVMGGQVTPQQLDVLQVLQDGEWTMTKIMSFLRNLFGLAKPEEEKQEKTGPQKTANPAPIVRAPFVPKKFDPGATMMVRDMKPYQPEEPVKKDANQAENKSALG